MFTKILCPTDLSENSLISVRYAVDLARKCQAKLFLLNVHEEFMSKEEMVMLRVSVDHFKEITAKRAVTSKGVMEKELEKISGMDIDHEMVLRQGKPDKEILETAKDLGCDLIILTTTGRDSLGEKILGSTAEHIIRYSEIPVLTIRV